ncbi:recombinase RecA [soil metagenome]
MAIPTTDKSESKSKSAAATQAAADKILAEKTKALELAVGAIEKQFGKGSIMRLGTNEPLVRDVSVVSTGALSLDIALGIGGLPKGRIVEIYGPESSGKTTLCLSVIAEAQKAGGVVAFVDAEHALDIGYARKLGVRTEDLLISQPDTGEQALEITETLVRSGAIDVLVVDSVAALVPRAEIEGDMGDSHVGLQARLMSQALRKLTSAIARSQTMVIFINQIRMKIGVMFGSPETTTGGNALKFYSSVRLDIRRIGAIKNGEEVVGNRTAVKVVKNKMAPPFAKAEFDLMYGEGFSLEGDVVDLGAMHNIIEKSGAWYSYNGERMGQGRDQAKQYLKDNKPLLESLRKKILELHKIGAIAPEVDSTLKADDGEDEEMPVGATAAGKATVAGNPAPALNTAPMAAPVAASPAASPSAKAPTAMPAAVASKDALKKASDEKKTTAMPAKK